MQVDPVLSLLVGALGAALIGLLGAWIQSRREHARWIREQRFDAYRDFFRVAERLAQIPDVDIEDGEQEFMDRFRSAIGTVRLVGPERVVRAATAHGLAAIVYARTVAREEPTAEEMADMWALHEETRTELLAVTREELGIKA